MADKISRLLCSCTSKFVTNWTVNSRRSLCSTSASSNRSFNFNSLSSAKVFGHPNFALEKDGEMAKNSWTRPPLTWSQQSIKDGLDLLNSHQNSISNPIQRLPIGIPINYRINPITYEDKNDSKRKPMEDPLTISNQIIIEDAPEVSKSRIEKRAARLIVIRRIKMNKHKLKKLRKKMKHIWAKVKLRRAIRRERAYLDEKLAQIRQAERFDAREHVATLIAKAKEKPIPRRWKGKRMPAWWIKEQIALGKITL